MTRLTNWTPEEIEELEILYLRGYTLNDIGLTLCRGGDTYHKRKATIWAALTRFGIYQKHGFRYPHRTRPASKRVPWDGAPE